MSQIISSVDARTGRRRRSRASRSACRGSPSRRRARAERAQRVRALHAEHRARRRCRGSRAGRSRSPPCSRRCTSPASSGAMWQRAPPDHDRDLALVVQEAAPRRSDHVAAVPVQRARRLHEERRRRAERRLELRAAALVVQVDADDLRRRRPAAGASASSSGDPAAVAGDQVVAVAGHRDVGAPSSWIRRVSIAVVCGAWRTCRGSCSRARPRAAPRSCRRRPGTTRATSSRWSTARRPATVARWLPERRRARRRGPRRRRARSGPTGSRAARAGAELLDPVRSQYKEAFVVVRCRRGGETFSRCILIWVDKDFALARGWYQGYPKKLGSIWMTRPVTVGRAGPRLEPGGRFGATPRGERPAPRRGHAHPDRSGRDRRVRERAADAALAVDAGGRPGGARRARRARGDAVHGRRGRARRGRARPASPVRLAVGRALLARAGRADRRLLAAGRRRPSPAARRLRRS